MDRHKNLPFAMYDLAVYLPGGIVFLAISQIILHKFNIEIKLPLFHDEDDKIGIFIRSLIWLSFGYLFGHILAFISSYFIEKQVHNSLGYPAAVWLQYEQDYESGQIEVLTNKQKFGLITSKMKTDLTGKIIGLAQIPALCPLSILRYLGFLGFYSPKLPYGLKARVASNLEWLRLGVQIEFGSRWEKVVEHHVANNNDSAYGRMYNYLVIYGALRMMSCLILMAIWATVIYSLFNFSRIWTEGNFIQAVEISAIYSVLIATYSISLMAFAKFNRRYFEESILAFALQDLARSKE